LGWVGFDADGGLLAHLAVAPVFVVSKQCRRSPKKRPTDVGLV